MPRIECCLLAILLAAVFPQIAEACPVCFRDPESPMTAGVAAGVGTLLSITAGVLSGFAVLVRRLIRAERHTRLSAERGGGQ